MITIKDIKVILTQPNHSPLAIVKVITSEPGLYGLGCASFSRHVYAVEAAIEHRFKPLLLGFDVTRIEEIWQTLCFDGYYRHGPVLNNAISGIDMALWDIKGKLAGMPVYELLGGKSREAANVYVHADGPTVETVIENMHQRIAQGYRFLRVQLGIYGGVTQKIPRPEGAAQNGRYFDPKAYMRDTLKLLTTIRAEFGDEIELLHDVHERLTPIQAVQFAKDVEPFKLYFLEDVLAPEDNEWFRTIREQTSTPLAMGEIYTNPREWQPVIAQRLIDFIRIHISYIGGITPAWKLTAFADMFGVRTAWHGPSGTSPVGHAANLHLDLWAPNFGVQEWYNVKELDYEMFPGLPEIRDGYMYPNDKPGLGIDIDEKLAAQHPPQPLHEYKPEMRVRLPDGTPVRP
ncbi:MAG: enolase C-terminal domain-like protein [Chloroflexota bacterium]